MQLIRQKVKQFTQYTVYQLSLAFPVQCDILIIRRVISITSHLRQKPKHIFARIDLMDTLIIPKCVSFIEC